jgi:GNAT superfamily N-acetyltransferase
MNPVHFRPAMPYEAAFLSEIAFAAKSYWGYPAEWMELWRPDLTITPRYLETEKVCVIESGDEIVGFAGLSSNHLGRNMEHLWLRPAHIGRGLGRRLFGETVRLARDEGTTRLFVNSDPNAEGFYIKMGAIRIGLELYELPGGAHRKIPLLVYLVP